jgi:hypothetical protein
MWIVSGPRSRVPEEGDGIEARKGKARRFCPRAADAAAVT